MLLVPAGLLLLAPDLLSTRPLRSTLEGLLSRHYRLPIRLRDAELGWFRPTVLEGLSLASPEHPDHPYLRVERVEFGASLLTLLLGQEPFELTVERATLQLDPDPGNSTPLAACLDRAGRTRLLERAARWKRITLRNSRLSLAGRTTELEARIENDSGALSLLKLEARVLGNQENPAARPDGALALKWRRAGEGARPQRLSVVASGFSLSGFEPLWRALFPGGSLSGQVDLTLDGSAGPGLFDLSAEGRLRGLVISGGPAWLAGGLRDSLIQIGGSCSIDLPDRRCSFHEFRLSSSIFFVQADGAAFADQGPLGGDLRLRAGTDLGRALARGSALVRQLLQVKSLGGNLDLTLEPADGGGFHLVASLEQFQSRLDSRRLLAPGEARLETNLRIGPSGRSLRLEQSSLSLEYADLSGNLRIGLDPDAGENWDLEAELRAETGRSSRTLFQALGRTPSAQVAGEVVVKLDLSRQGGLLNADLRIDSEDFDLRVDPKPGGPDDTYFFRAQPLRLGFRGSLQGADSLRTPTGSFSLQAGVCTILRDELFDLDLTGELQPRTIVLNNATARTARGGRLSLTGSMRLPPDRPASLLVRVQGDDLELLPFTTRLAAICSPAFAYRTHPWNLESSVRISGRLELEARGWGTGDFLKSLGGSGELRFSAGELVGSAVLDRLIPPRGRPGPRTITGGGSDLLIDAGRFEVRSWLAWPEGRVDFRGHAGTDGRIEYRFPPEALFDPDFLLRYGDRIPAGLFGVSGTISAPRVALPDPVEWSREAEQGRIDRIIRRFRELSSR